MQINGRWVRDEGGVFRPYVYAESETDSGEWLEYPLLVDTEADRTVLSADVLSELGRPSSRLPVQLSGIGGEVETLQVQARVRLIKTNGETILLKGPFSAFADPAALDSSVLGRDVLNQFALLVDRPNNTLCLLHGRHRAVIQES